MRGCSIDALMYGLQELSTRGRQCHSAPSRRAGRAAAAGGQSAAVVEPEHRGRQPIALEERPVGRIVDEIEPPGSQRCGSPAAVLETETRREDAAGHALFQASADRACVPGSISGVDATGRSPYDRTACQGSERFASLHGLSPAVIDAVGSWPN